MQIHVGGLGGRLPTVPELDDRADQQGEHDRQRHPHGDDDQHDLPHTHVANMPKGAGGWPLIGNNPAKF